MKLPNQPHLEKRPKLSTMAARVDNRISQGSVFRPMSKQDLSAGNRPKRLVEFNVNHGGFSYEATVKQFEALSMDDELVLLVCLSMIARFSRGKVLNPPNACQIEMFGTELENQDAPEAGIDNKELLWKKLNVETSTSPQAIAAGLLDYTRVPVLMLETAPAEILRKLKRDDSGKQISRLIRSLERLESTTMRFRVKHPDCLFSFGTSLLAFTYTEPKHNTGTPSLRIALNHFSVQALSRKNGGFTLHQVEEKIGISELESAIHSQLCRLATPAKATSIRYEKLYTDSYGVSSTKDLTRYHSRRFLVSLHTVSEHLTSYGWQFGKKDETCFVVKRPAAPKPERFLAQHIANDGPAL